MFVFNWLMVVLWEYLILLVVICSLGFVLIWVLEDNIKLWFNCWVLVNWAVWGIKILLLKIVWVYLFIIYLWSWLVVLWGWFKVMVLWVLFICCFVRIVKAKNLVFVVFFCCVICKLWWDNFVFKLILINW